MDWFPPDVGAWLIHQPVVLSFIADPNAFANGHETFLRQVGLTMIG